MHVSVVYGRSCGSADLGKIPSTKKNYAQAFN